MRTRNRLPGKRRRRCFWCSLRRVLEYHGEEHEAICCLEKGLLLTTANVRAQSRLHPRCGANFLMMVMLLGLFAFPFFGGPPFYARVLLRLALLPVIAGLAYEWMRFAADSGSPLVRALNRPGLWLGLLTTRAPMTIRWKWPPQYFGARRAWQMQQPPGRNDKEDTVCRRNVWTGWNPALKIWKYS